MKTAEEIIKEAQALMLSIAVPTNSKYKWFFSIECKRPSARQVWSWGPLGSSQSDELMQAIGEDILESVDNGYFVVRLAKERSIR